jgi:hypothetical protein
MDYRKAYDDLDYLNQINGFQVVLNWKKAQFKVTDFVKYH